MAYQIRRTAYQRIINKSEIGGQGLLERFDGLSKNRFKSIYTTSEDDLMSDFYIPCLAGSTKYDRIAGYFSSAIYALAPIALSDFISKEGKIRLLCSPNLTKVDLNLLANPKTILDASIESIKQELAEISQGGEVGQLLTKIMADMISLKIIEIRISVPENGKGIYHDKMGIFSDSENSVLFIGSANETAAAWVGDINHEQITTFSSWSSDENRRTIDQQKSRFEKSWAGFDRGWRVLTGDKAEGFLKNYKSDDNIEVSIQNLREILKKTKKPFTLLGNSHPRRKMHDHQSQVFENWKRAQNRGLVVFATGGGKTVVGIQAIEYILKNRMNAVVMVPSILLLEQWKREIQIDLPYENIQIFGGKYGFAGREDILRLLLNQQDSDRRSIVLTTFGSASTTRFLNILRDSKEVGVVVDEVHGIGSPNYRKILECLSKSNIRLGLSATPKRFNDSIGTAAIYNFFGEELEPEFSLSDAISKNILVEYDYEFRTINLNDDEQFDFDNLTNQIAQMYARLQNGEDTPYIHGKLKNLRIARAKIIKSASGKIPLALEILQEHFKEGDRWLVYCQSQEQMNLIRGKIQHLPIHILEYHSNMDGDRKAQLDFFEKQGGVMLAIKCLDEGIDIPIINRALILASSSNPREYIQRRGRVLRKYPDKHSARIIDTLVQDSHGEVISVGELQRAYKFSLTARNKAIQFELENIIRNSPFANEIELEDEDEG